jgi:phospholipid/cholesterol/gamma-HCH transport system substrate-binding protein
MVNRSFTVGLFAIAGLTLFTVGLFLVGNRVEAFARHMDFYAEFTDLAGLSKGAKVQVAGMNAGQIVEIAIPDSPSSRFRVKLRINEKLHGLVRTDSVATIGTEGVVGDTFVLIRPGSSKARAAAAQSTLPSKEPTEIADLLDQGKGVLTDVDNTVKNANGLLTSVGGNLNSTLDGVKATVSNANDVVLGLKEGRGPAGLLLRDQALAGQIRQTVTNTQQATADLGHASKQANGLISDIESRHFPQKVDDTMASVKSAAANLDATAQQIHQTIAEVAEPDEQGITGGVNIRESLSNANAATANMADETEALKHNFFFRGFFRHRGYYTLANIDPSKYRKDAIFTRSSNYRAWLPANELFQRDPNGLEQLTTQGRVLLNSVVAQYGDSVVESPIVIEGYSVGGNAADQLASSRNRAIVVRRYLQMHFQLDPGNLGAVPMMNVPPRGLDHPTWDGICIVVLKDRS